jgi:Glyoxalase/Bleomycin resistance protein/Dioxygenase superfamily
MDQKLTAELVFDTNESSVLTNSDSASSAMKSPLGPPVQIAYAVRDVRQAATRWVERYGAGPFTVIDHIELSAVRYRGAPGSFDHSSAYGQWGQIMVELVCDHTIGSSPVADVVGPGGEGLHHHAHFVPDLAEAQRVLEAHGWPEVLHAVTPSGLSFAFHDATADLGHMIELYEPTPSLVAFYQRVANDATDWDGTNPVRSR